MFDGKMKVFRSEGGAVKTDDEKRQMAEKHRFKKHREFKQRIEEQEQNEDADIRSFTFHRHEVFEDRKSRKTGYSTKPGKTGKTGKPFKRRNRFDDDED
jgi:putative N6-adenine-specific DNA methylase